MFDYYSDEEGFKEANGYTIENVWYPRVTKIVSIKAKPALLRFYGEAENFKSGQAITQKSAEEGTLVHEAAEAILLGKEPDVNPSIAPAIDAFRRFLEEKNIHTLPEYVEKRVFHPTHRYAGTVDALALIDGKFGVLDIKTSQAIYRDYNLQTAAYMDALKSHFENLQTRWILRIDQIQKCLVCGATRRLKGGREKIRLAKNGGRPLEHEHEWSELQGEIEIKEFPYWQNDFQAFLGAKKLWEWENEFWLKKVGYL
ncbi:hypothetical protein C4571_00080 [Candidatus Parcubacteria bacterium]|nr:MAG: hypothetical protein C4571_00080 [Candidatus Parcubacteria bacterium]